jgi:hypothetical protein
MAFLPYAHEILVCNHYPSVGQPSCKKTNDQAGANDKLIVMLPQFGEEKTCRREQKNRHKEQVGQGSIVDIHTKRVLDRPIRMRPWAQQMFNHRAPPSLFTRAPKA